MIEIFYSLVSKKAKQGKQILEILNIWTGIYALMKKIFKKQPKEYLVRLFDLNIQKSFMITQFPNRDIQVRAY